ncbi:EGF region [Echinococcus multilocularis]|uniref:EGF region n=1 Tax=Echinococcus multilocularis TaxID=6211 RepID=A0A068Y272_ECHMU|nr:EGF region [Echinococcus multilocularis]
MQVPVVSVVNLRFSNILSYRKYEGASRRCQRAIQALHGVYGAQDYNRIMQNNSHWPYGVGETREANTRTMQSWTQHLFKQTWMYIPIYLQHDLVPERPFSSVSGLITTERLVAIREVMEKCVEALAKPLKAALTAFPPLSSTLLLPSSLPPILLSTLLPYPLIPPPLPHPHSALPLLPSPPSAAPILSPHRHFCHCHVFRMSGSPHYVTTSH